MNVVIPATVSRSVIPTRIRTVFVLSSLLLEFVVGATVVVVVDELVVVVASVVVVGTSVVVGATGDGRFGCRGEGRRVTGQRRLLRRTAQRDRCRGRDRDREHRKHSDDHDEQTDTTHTVDLLNVSVALSRFRPAECGSRRSQLFMCHKCPPGLLKGT